MNLDPVSNDAMSDEEYEAGRERRAVPVDNRHTYASCSHERIASYPKCQTCVGDRNRNRVDTLRDVIRDLKASVDSPMSNDEERRLFKALKEYDHPDPDSLMRWLQSQREGGSKKGKRK
jgi:hypothetical protein